MAAADVVLANLTAALLVRHVVALVELIRRRGYLVLSGFAPPQGQVDVMPAFRQLRLVQELVEGDWQAVLLRRTVTVQFWRARKLRTVPYFQRSPHRCCRTPRAMIVTASARSVRRPSVIGNVAGCGRRVDLRRTPARLQDRPARSQTPADRCETAPRRRLSTGAPGSTSNSRRSASSCSSHSSNSVPLPMMGRTARRHCFADAIAIRRHRSAAFPSASPFGADDCPLRQQRLDRRHAHHRRVAHDLVHLIAFEDGLREGQADGGLRRGVISSSRRSCAPSRVTRSMRARYSRPLPSNTEISSPKRNRKT